MAEKKPETDEVQVPKKRGKLLLFIIIGALVVVLGGGAAAYFLLKKKAPTDEEDTGEEPTAKSAKKARHQNPDAPPVFVKLEPFTVKLQTENQEAYLQTTPELRVLDAPVSDRIKQYMPEIRHRILLLMSGKRASELSSPQGVQKLANEIRVEMNTIIDGPKVKVKGKGKEPVEAPEADDRAGPDDSVQAVLFTSFIIQ